MVEENRERAHVFISGRVQGVFYRANTKEMAAEMEVDGWVKNLNDGRVEAVFEGRRKNIEKIIDWCWEGSSQANVEDIDVSWEDPRDIEGFEIKY